MIITMPKHQIYSKQAALLAWKRTALTLLYKYRFGAAEHSINTYLLQNYNISLIGACRLLLNTCRVGEIYSNAIEIFWMSTDCNKLFHIIANGVGNVHWSNIIAYVFR